MGMLFASYCRSSPVRKSTNVRGAPASYSELTSVLRSLRIEIRAKTIRDLGDAVTKCISIEMTQLRVVS